MQKGQTRHAQQIQWFLFGQQSLKFCALTLFKKNTLEWVITPQFLACLACLIFDLCIPGLDQ